MQDPPRPTMLRQLVRIADRPGLRGLLGWLTSVYARRVTSRPISVFHDDVWLHRTTSGAVFSAGLRFSYYKQDLLDLDGRFDQLQSDSNDYWFHTYKPALGDVILDVGAEIGGDTVAFSRAVGPTGKVIAIEAHPTTFRMLTKVCQWNRLTNTICQAFAVSSAEGTVHIADGDSPEANMLVDSAVGKSFAVPAVTIDQLCARLGIERIDYLKMNIEGAEREAILGMQKIIKRTRAVTIACHDFRAANGEGGGFSTRAVVEEFLLGEGFVLSHRSDDPRPHVRDHIHGLRQTMPAV